MSCSLLVEAASHANFFFLFSSFSSPDLDNNIKMDELLHNAVFLGAHNQRTACGDKREIGEEGEAAI